MRSPAGTADTSYFLWYSGTGSTDPAPLSRTRVEARVQRVREDRVVSTVVSVCSVPGGESGVDAQSSLAIKDFAVRTISRIVGSL